MESDASQELCDILNLFRTFKEDQKAISIPRGDADVHSVAKGV